MTEGRRVGKIQLRKKLKVGTWNVRSLLQLGKTQIVCGELERYRLDICGLAEVRWGGRGHFTTAGGHRIVYSGEDKQGQKGVGIWLNRRIAGALIGYEPINSRLITVRLNAKPRNISIIQVYAPTSEQEEEQIEQFYMELTTAIARIPKKDIIMVLGDFNAKVGKGRWSSVVGEEGLGELNTAGERLIDFCMEQDIRLTNTWFKQHPRRLYTWTGPGGQVRNQINHISIQQK